jgi:hypothetical protein
MSASAVFVIALFFGFVILYMGLRARGFFTPPVDIMTLRLGNMEHQQSVPGMIIRYEEVFQTDRDGRVVFAVQEFDHVREGVLVASIRDIEAVRQNEEDLERLQQEVLGVHEMRHATQTDPLVERLNSNLKTRMDRTSHHHMQMNLSEVYALLELLTQNTDNRNRMILTESLHTRGELNHRHDYLANQRENSLSDIYATHSGNMSPIIDGFENRENFTPATMREISREQVRMTIDHETIIPGREVYAGDDIFKIVGNTWYVASWVSNEMAMDFTVGAERAVYLENAVTGKYERVPMRIEYLRDTPRETLVIFRSSRHVIEFLNQRSVNIRLTDNVQSGFMIPSSAVATRRFFRIPRTHLHGVDDYFVMHRRDDGLQPIPVEISEENATDVYVLEETFPLSYGDGIAPVDSADLFHILTDADMRIVRGVYRTTMNFADFRTIHIDGGLPEEGGPVLLDPAKNPTIRQFDSIVIDAAMVKQGQVVR